MIERVSEQAPKVLNRKFNIGEDLRQKPRADQFTGVNRNHSLSPVAVFEHMMTSLHSNYDEACSFERAKKLLSFQSWESGHVTPRCVGRR